MLRVELFLSPKAKLTARWGSVFTVETKGVNATRTNPEGPRIALGGKGSEYPYLGISGKGG